MEPFTGNFSLIDFPEEQSRIAVNLEAAYLAQRDAKRARSALGPNLTWRRRGDLEYLYTVDSAGGGKSLGPRSPDTESRFDLFKRERERLLDLERGASVQLDLQGRLYKAARLLQISPRAAAILRMLDELSMLDRSLIVVGTNTMAAYEMEAAARFVGADDAATRDFDVAVAGAPVHRALATGVTVEATVFSALKRVDETYTINSERTFQARNRDAYEVELIAAPSQLRNIPAHEKLQPLEGLPEQEWLLKGRRVDHVVGALDGSAARIVAPDPRWMALHKIWLSRKPARTPLKKGKDARQGHMLLAAVIGRMPHYPLDDAFQAELPGELAELFDPARRAAESLLSRATHAGRAPRSRR